MSYRSKVIDVSDEEFATLYETVGGSALARRFGLSPSGVRKHALGVGERLGRALWAPQQAGRTYISDETIQKVLSDYDTNREFGDKREEAAKRAGVAICTIEKYKQLAAKRGLLGFKPVLPGFNITKISTTVDENGDALRNYVTQKPAESQEQFELPVGHVVRGVSALVGADGEVKQQWIKTKIEETAYVDALQEAFGVFRGHSILIPPPEYNDETLLSVYPIADQHNGLLAWGRETGEAYDLQIGVDRLRATMARLVSQSPPSGTGLILNLGDWQHTDDGTNATPRGNNLLDADGRYMKILVAGVDLMKDCIELGLQKHAKIIVKNLPGNHDPHASVALTVALSSFYSNNPRVVIDDSPDEFFYYRFGATLIGANHGHKAKPVQMAMSMATRRREDWGETKYHVCYFGHIHHETVVEVGDVRVESFQTLAAKDAYAGSHGYNSGQSLTSITFHVEDGEIGRHRINIAPPSIRARA